MNSNRKLKILIISNLYPPYYIGGYELFCKDVADGLIKKGHKVHILTSSYKCRSLKNERFIKRLLHLIGSFERGEKTVLSNTELEEIFVQDRGLIKTEIDKFRPDLIYIWHMANIHKELMNVLIESKVPFVYHFEDRWIPSFYYEMFSYFLGIRIAYFKYLFNKGVSISDLLIIFKKIIRRLKRFLEKQKDNNRKMILPRLNLRRSIFLSKALLMEHKKLGFNVTGAAVIYNGVDVSKFQINQKRNYPYKNFKLLYIGRVAEKKGVHSLIEALGIIKKEGFSPTLTIVGETDDTEFLEKIKKMVLKYQMENQVKFVGGVKRAKTAWYYKNHDILVFPSIWEEPFGLVLIEAMSASLPIISTNTGGTKEFLRHNKNCLIFKPMDVQTLATHIKLLLTSRDRYEQLSRYAYIFVRKSFDIQMSIDKIERYLLKHAT